MTRTNILFGLTAVLLLAHISPLEVYFDQWSVIVLGIMYLFCFVEKLKLHQFDAELGPTGAKMSLNTEKKKERKI